MLPPIKEPRKPLRFPRWMEWALVAAMFVLALLEFVHGQMFWAIFWAAATLILSLSAAGFFKRSADDGEAK